MTVYGGNGDDVFDTDRDQDMGEVMTDVRLYGDAGNDKMTLLQSTPKMYGSGGDGDDKIIYFGNTLVKVTGDAGSDIIYGTDGSAMPAEKIYGDYDRLTLITDPDLAGVGGDDKIYGGNGPKIGNF